MLLATTGAVWAFARLFYRYRQRRWRRLARTLCWGWAFGTTNGARVRASARVRANATVRAGVKRGDRDTLLRSVSLLALDHGSNAWPQASHSLHGPPRADKPPRPGAAPQVTSSSSGDSATQIVSFLQRSKGTSAHPCSGVIAARE